MRLTRQEILLVTAVLLAVVLGAAVKRFRDGRRFALPAPVPGAVKGGASSPKTPPAALPEPADP